MPSLVRSRLVHAATGAYIGNAAGLFEAGDLTNGSTREFTAKFMAEPWTILDGLAFTSRNDRSDFMLPSFEPLVLFYQVVLPLF